MSAPITQADLSQCEREPIHLLGGLQPHGVLLAFSEPELTLKVVSANTEALLGRAPEALLGRALSEVLCPASLFLLTQALARPEGRLLRLEVVGRAFVGLVHRGDGLVLLELEPVEEGGLAEGETLVAVDVLLSPLHRAKGPQALLQTVADAVRTLTGFDRVMVYRFNEDWHGEVVAESLGQGVEGFLGMHFPASDIPAQARALYTRNTLRLIADARARPVPLVPAVLPALGRPLDLSGAALRSVSPVHLEYLANMGVGASFSVSLLREGKLWGLIACHHGSPRQVPPGTRHACDVLARLLSLQLVTEERTATAEELARRASLHSQLVEQLSKGAHSLTSALSQREALLLALTGAQGAALVLGEAPVLVGMTPTAQEVQSLAAWLQEQPFEVPFHTARLETLHPPAAAYAQVASGLLAVRLDPVAPRFALWFRPEVARTVTWAGDPRKPVVRGPGAERLHPRASFDAWKQEVRGTSLPWTQVDLEMARRFREGLVGVVLRQAAALARSNVELDSFSGTVAHDLREPLRGIQQYVSFTLEDYGEGLPPEGRDYLKQAERLAQRTQGLLESLFEYSRLGFVDLSWKEADLQQVLEDELLTVSARLKQNRVEVRIPRPLPRLECDALRLGHVWANLLANAAKYHQPDEPRWVEVGYYAPDEPLPAQARPRAEGYIFYVRDNGIGIAPQFQETIFAMFRRLHAPQAYGGGSGAGLAIARRLVQLHGGSLWVESTPGQGSTFYFTVGRRP